MSAREYCSKEIVDDMNLALETIFVPFQECECVEEEDGEKDAEASCSTLKVPRDMSIPICNS